MSQSQEVAKEVVDYFARMRQSTRNAKILRYISKTIYRDAVSHALELQAPYTRKGRTNAGAGIEEMPADMLEDAFAWWLIYDMGLAISSSIKKPYKYLDLDTPTLELISKAPEIIMDKYEDLINTESPPSHYWRKRWPVYSHLIFDRFDLFPSSYAKIPHILDTMFQSLAQVLQPNKARAYCEELHLAVIKQFCVSLIPVISKVISHNAADHQISFAKQAKRAAMLEQARADGHVCARSCIGFPMKWAIPRCHEECCTIPGCKSPEEHITSEHLCMWCNGQGHCIEQHRTDFCPLERCGIYHRHCIHHHDESYWL